MLNIEITYDQGQFKELMNKLDGFERRQVVHQTTTEVAEFMRGKVQEYPPYKYVSRREAYGVTFFSDKQRRWFFAALRSGDLQLPYRRTDTLKGNWRIAPTGQNQLNLSNETSYAGLVQGTRQSRMMIQIGWRTTDEYVKQYEGEIGRIGLKNVNDWLNS